MKFSFKSFAIGFACAALSLGAVTYANAASNGTLKACANKTTGVMRYISKGSCKKTEISLSWNQMGPQGLPGSAGTNGTAGAKGETGTAGNNGAAGTNGQNLRAVDTAGKDLGQVTGTDGSSISVLIDGTFFNLTTSKDAVQGMWVLSYFRDSSCTIPLLAMGGDADTTPFPQVAFFVVKNSAYSPSGAYLITGLGFSPTSLNTVYEYRVINSSCVARNPNTEFGLQGATLWDTKPIELPKYTGSLRIVVK